MGVWKIPINNGSENWCSRICLEDSKEMWGEAPVLYEALESVLSDLWE